MAKKINNIKKAFKNTSLSVTALALYLDVNESTVSKWNSNIEEPAIKSLDDIGEVFEIDNSELLHANNRVKTGLAEALQLKYKELLKAEVPKKIESTNSKGNKIMVNNPEFVKALQDFVVEYKKNKK